ncbi:MAG: hypothetical protein ACK5SX_15010 [Sandaracinobacter sp.]
MPDAIVAAEKLGLRPKDIAEIVGITADKVSKIRAGKRRLTIEEFGRLNRHLKGRRARAEASVQKRPSPSAPTINNRFEAPKIPQADGSMAELERLISTACAEALKGKGAKREAIAMRMSAMLGETVSRWMLDAYASPARDGHKVPASRFFALIVVTGRFDLLDAIIGQVGGRVLVGEQIGLARLGHLVAQQAAIQDQIDAVIRISGPLRDGGAR